MFCARVCQPGWGRKSRTWSRPAWWEDLGRPGWTGKTASGSGAPAGRSSGRVCLHHYTHTHWLTHSDMYSDMYSDMTNSDMYSDMTYSDMTNSDMYSDMTYSWHDVLWHDKLWHVLLTWRTLTGTLAWHTLTCTLDMTYSDTYSDMYCDKLDMYCVGKWKFQGNKGIKDEERVFTYRMTSPSTWFILQCIN